jgi:RHS repeat-associated protein
VLVRSRQKGGCIDNVCHDVVTRTVWDGDRILHEIRAPASRMEEDTAVAAEGGSGDPRTGQVTYVFGTGLDQPLALYREGYHPLFPERIHIVPHANWRGDYDMGTYDGLREPPCKALPPVNPGDHEEVGGGPDSQQDTVPRPTHYVCMVVEWPAAYLWMSHLSRENTPAGPRSWTGSLIENKRDLTGLLYMRNRYYDPKTGRFTQEDPIGLAGGLNAYGFADGDPVSYSDPYGLCKKPTGLKKGEVGICIETFIAGPSAGVPRATADNRTFSSTGGTYRTSDRFIVQADGNVRNASSGKGKTFGILPGVGDISHSSVAAGGTTVISASMDVRTLSPWPPFNINYDFNITVAGGDVRVSGTHDGFPSYEIWAYQEGKNARLVYGHRETNVLDLRGCCDQKVKP